jgi:hypothetical protein
LKVRSTKRNFAKRSHNAFFFSDDTTAEETQANKPKMKHVNRRLTDKERARHARIIAAALKDIPPMTGAKRKAKSRKARGFSVF